MIRVLVAGTLLFAAFAVAFAPAGLLRHALPPDGAVQLLATSGTIWRGGGRLQVADVAAGELTWRFRPGALLSGGVGYQLRLLGPEHDLQGPLHIGFDGLTGRLDGGAGAAFLDHWLAPQGIAGSGEVTAAALAVRLPWRQPLRDGSADGRLRWSGGPLGYVLPDGPRQQVLPPLVAELGPGLEAVVVADGATTPLLRARLLEDGFVQVGLTRHLLEMLGSPWPGDQEAHETVLEYEEQLF